MKWEENNIKFPDLPGRRKYIISSHSFDVEKKSYINITAVSVSVISDAEQNVNIAFVFYRMRHSIDICDAN